MKYSLISFLYFPALKQGRNQLRILGLHQYFHQNQVVFCENLSNTLALADKHEICQKLACLLERDMIFGIAEDII